MSCSTNLCSLSTYFLSKTCIAVTVSRTTVPFPGNISNLFLLMTSRKCLRANCACLTLHSKSFEGFLSVVHSRDSVVFALFLGEDGDAERPTEPPGDRICDMISRKSSLNDLARRASRFPRDFPQTGESPETNELK